MTRRSGQVAIAVSLCLSALAGCAGRAFAATEAKGTAAFNKDCPAARLCPVMERAYQACRPAKTVPKCRDFVETMRLLAPVYDCQRPFDGTYTVPALWICNESQRAGGGGMADAYYALLSVLKTPDARRFFASPEFRQTLDGEMAEMYRAKSERLERELKRGGKK